MRYRVFSLSGCVGEFVAYRFEIDPKSKSNLRAFVRDSGTSVDILYQEAILLIRDDHDRTVYNEAFGPRIEV